MSKSKRSATNVISDPMKPENKEAPPTLKELFSMLSDEELKDVEETFYDYAEIVLRIVDRKMREEKEGAMSTDLEL
jgi:hypothetical protein